MLDVVFSVVVLFHGVGHLLFLVPLLGIADWGQSTRSWLLSPFGQWAAVGGGSLIWLAATIGFCAVSFGFLTPADWWRTLAIASATISAVGIILFWSNPASPSAFSAFVFDLIVLVALIIFRWNP